MFDDKEPNSKDQTRLMLALALSALVLVLFGPKPPIKKPDAGKPPVTSPAKPAAGASSATGGTAAPTATTTAPPVLAKPVPAVSESKETDTVVESDLYEVHFSNRGGVATSWILRKYKDGDRKPLDIVNPIAVSQTGWPLSILTDDSDARTTLSQALFSVKTTGRQAPATITFEYSNGSLAARKEFRFDNSYVVHISTEVSRDGKPILHEVSWRGGFGDRSVPKYNLLDTATTSLGDRQEHKGIKDVKADNLKPNGPFSYGSIEDLFFCAVFMPGGEGEAAPPIFPSFTIYKNTYAASVGDPLELLGVAAGGEASNHLRAYVGPKDLTLLRTIHPDPNGEKQGPQAATLGSLIDFGWFWFVALPMFVALKWMYAHVVANYGWSVILLTTGINFALLPLRISSMKSSQKMQKLQPQIKAIQDRYKKYKMSDPKKQEANEEIMALYKKEGVNPMGGCLPLFIQIPFFYGFYRMLSQTIEMRHASWLWVADLSRPEAGWFHVLPICFIASMLILQRMTPQPAGDPMQQKMMQIMPLAFGIGFYNVSSGLVLYWLTGNLVQLAQQYYFNKTAPAKT